VLESGLIVNRLAKMIGLPEAEIRKELGRRIKPPAEPVRNDRTQGGLPATDWGEGLYAYAQREILEVLLNEPGLYHNVEQGISQDIFDVPALAQIASILWGVIQSDEDFSLSRVLALVESVQIGERIVELQQVGEKKGNYHARLMDALETLRRRQDHPGNVRTNRAAPSAGSPAEAGGPHRQRNPNSMGILKG